MKGRVTHARQVYGITSIHTYRKPGANVYYQDVLYYCRWRRCDCDHSRQTAKIRAVIFYADDIILFYVRGHIEIVGSHNSKFMTLNHTEIDSAIENPDGQVL